MQPYLFDPLFAAMALASLGGACLLMGSELRANRSAAAWLLLAAWWAACEVLWNTAPDAATALWLHRLAGPGFIFIAPLAMQFVFDMAEAPPPALRRLLPAAFGLAALFLLLTWTSDSMLADMQREAWGWALVPGPAFGVWSVLTGIGIALAVHWFITDYRASATWISRQQGPRVIRVVVPIAILGIFTDVFLPLAGVQIARLGTLAMAIVGATVVSALSRYGFSRLHPQAFSTRVLHTLPDAIALTTLHGRIRIANEKLGELLGCPAEDVLGRQIGEHLDAHLIDPPREQREVDCTLRRVDGAMIPVCASTAPVGGPDGTVVGVVIAIQDLREVAALRNRLVTSGRLAAVGQLAAGIAHEINNPLAFVRSNLGLLRREWEQFTSEASKSADGVPAELEDWAELLDESIEGVDRAATIVRDIRDFSHAGGSAPELIEPHRVLDQVLRVAHAQLDPGIRVETDYGDVGLVLCEPQRLKQVFLNLVVNAGQALGGAGRIRVSLRGEDDYVHAVVEDDGCGMRPEVRERIFDPFFTTKPVGSGTGLGLSIAYEIVRSHRGQIWCESEPGRGSAFHVRLPRRS